MKPPKPTGFNFEPPPKILVPDPTAIEEAPEDHIFEIKNPVLANLFHFGMIAIILFVAIIITIFFGRILGGILGVLGFAGWATSSNYYDKNKGGL